MKNSNRTASIAVAGILLAGLLGPAGAAAQSAPPSNGYSEAGGEEIRQTVARVSYLSGPVSYARGDDPDDWQSPDLNVPLTIGDRLYTGQSGRAELQIHGGVTVRLDANTDLAALNLTDDTKQFSQNIGAASFQVRRLGQEEIFEVDTPNAAVTFDAVGDYRIDVDNDGNTRVAVRTGRVLVASGGGQVTLNAGDEMDIDGIDRPQYGVYRLAAADSFDRWVSGRESRSQRSASRQYVSADIVGIADLDDSGRWEDIPEYGRAWSPASVASDWAPYRDGHWVWQDPWGWTWISGEPWGWAPYHYGRWVTYSSRWFWVPVAARVQTVAYAPALVAFVGGIPGPSASASFVGWFPLAPRDPFIPWWGRRAAVRATNVVYVNRSYVTVVNQNTFVSGGLVSRGWVRDPSVIRQVSAAPVVRGPLPFIPTQASLRVGVRPNLPAAPRPPAIVLSRAVVARVAPPPAPPAFSAKLDVIRQNRGAPVEPSAAARLVVQRGRPEPVTAIRPVVAEQGGVTLSPGGRREGAGAPVQANVQPVTAAPVRGRPLATVERPVAVPGTAAGAAAPAGSGNPRTIERGRPSSVGTSPATPATAGAPAAVAPAPQAPASTNPNDARSNQDRRNRAVERQVSPLPPAGPATGAIPVNPDEQTNRPRAVVRPYPAPVPPPTAPAATQQLEQSRRGRQVERPGGPPVPASGPQPTAAPPANSDNSASRDRRQRSVDRGQGQQPQTAPTAAPPPPENGNGNGRNEGRGRQVERAAPAQPPAAGQPEPQKPQTNARPAPEARGRDRSNAPKPTKEPKKDDKKPEK